MNKAEQHPNHNWTTNQTDPNTSKNQPNPAFQQNPTQTHDPQNPQINKNPSKTSGPRRAYLSAGENEDEVVVEIGEVREVLELLPNLRLIGGRRDLVLE